MRHEWDCEIYQLADLIKSMLKHEENIENYDDKKEFGQFVDDLIDGVKEVNETIDELKTECLIHMDRIEQLEDALYSDRELLDDAREELQDFKDKLREFCQ